MNNKHFENSTSFANYYHSINVPLFDIISVNMRSISSIEKFNKFKLIISKFPKLPSIIAVQETWFSSNITQIYNIFGYNAIHCCRTDGYGGTSIYINKSIEFKIESCESKDFIEAITISLQSLKMDGKSLKFTSLYRSQKCSLNSFLSFVENLLTRHGHYPGMVVCDSNINFLQNSFESDLIDTLSSFNYKNCHHMITRPETGTCIDHVYSNITDDIFIDTIACNLTDHYILSIKLNKTVNTYDYIETIKKTCDYEQVRNSLNCVLPLYQKTGNPSEDISKLIEIISSTVENATIEKRTRKIIKNELTPWMNKNLLNLINYKKKLLKLRRQGKYSVEDILKRVSRVIKKACRVLMNNYYHDNLNQIQKDPKKCWKFLNENLGRKIKGEINIIDDSGAIITGYQKSDTFNKYFLQIPKALKDEILCLPGDSCNSLRTLQHYQSVFNFSYITEVEIIDTITEFDLKKSCGPDGISAKIVFQCKETLSPHLATIFNNMLVTGTYPEDLKIAKIVPIPKTTNAVKVEDFRPIALLSIIDKIFEKILHKQLSSYFNYNSLLYERQYGFKKGSGTEEAVVNVVNNICKGLDEGFSGVAGIFYDFSKAFDLVDHIILIQKLVYYGVEARALALLKSYLSNRKQYVEVNNLKSSVGMVEYGVPQGSVLGPLLFSIYLNDLKNLKFFGKLYMFADDISVFYPYKHETSLKAHMEYDAAMIMEYARINRLCLNAEKTRVLRFRPYIDHGQNFSIFVDGKLVHEVSSTKYLGVHLQSNLSWDLHIKSLKSKIASATGLIYKFKNKFNVETKLLIYQALIQSHLNYLAIVYSWNKSNEFRSLQRSQNKALKTVFNLQSTFSTLRLYKDVSPKILPIYGLHKMQLLLYVYKSVHNIGHHTIQFSRNQHNLNTRNASNLSVSFCRLEKTKQKITHMGSLEYNRLPEDIRNIERISMFKRSVKEYLFDNMEMLLL